MTFLRLIFKFKDKQDYNRQVSGLLIQSVSEKHDHKCPKSPVKSTEPPTQYWSKARINSQQQRKKLMVDNHKVKC